jgi:hypothetical protein
MARPPAEQFRKHRLPPLEPSPPVKRSGHVALLVMGTLAVGGGAYAMMPHDNCDPRQAGVAAPATPGQPQQNTACQTHRSSSSGSHWYGSSHSGYYGGSSSHVRVPGGSATSSGGLAFSGASGGGVARGGFGGFGHSISAHFSGG